MLPKIPIKASVSNKVWVSNKTQVPNKAQCADFEG